MSLEFSKTDFLRLEMFDAMDVDGDGDSCTMREIGGFGNKFMSIIC